MSRMVYHGRMDTPIKRCHFCETCFSKKKSTSQLVWQKQKYCSWPCRAKGSGLLRRGKILSPETCAKISISLKGEKNYRYGIKMSAREIAKLRAALKAKTTGPLHCRWKGDAASYRSLHRWLNRHYPKTGICERCGMTRYTEYANLKVKWIDRKQYRRDRMDYAELCILCHHEQDGRRRSEATGRFISSSIN